MMETAMNLGMSVTVSGTIDSVQERVTAALKAEGFGVLTQIDVKETLKQKLDVDFRPYRILGACNPTLAHRALSAAPQVGLLLPCNVTLSQTSADSTEVSVVDPLSMLGVIHLAELSVIAEEAQARLARVVKALES